MEGRPKVMEVRRAVRNAKPLLEWKYHVKISGAARDWAVEYGLGIRGVSDGPSPAKSVEILEEACKRKAQKFKDFEFGRELEERAYDLRCALVEYNELYRDGCHASRSWLAAVEVQRDSSTDFINSFLGRWEDVLTPSSTGPSIWTPRMVDNLRLLSDKVSAMATSLCGESGKTRFKKLARGIDHLLDIMMEKLFDRFRAVLTVHTSDISEVVGNLVDIPRTQLHDQRTELVLLDGVSKIKNRFVSTEPVIDEILGMLSNPKHSTMRPRATFLLLGPRGVGKTGIAMAFAKHFYCDVSRLVQVDMEEYAEPQLESASCDLSRWLDRKQQDLLNSLTAVVRRRPYSVIVLDHIEKAHPSVTRALFDVLTSDAPVDSEGNSIDFSNSIIFMTSSVGSNQLGMVHMCFIEKENLPQHIGRDKFDKIHYCTRKVDYSESALEEARAFFGADQLKRLDKVLVVEKFKDSKAVARVLLRESVEETFGREIFVHISDAALDVLLASAYSMDPFGAGMAIKKALHQQIVSHLLDMKIQEGIVCVDTLVGTRKLSFRHQINEREVDDWLFKQQEGKLHQKIVDFRMKMKSIYSIFDLRRKGSSILKSCADLPQLGWNLADICNLMSMLVPCPDLPPKCAREQEDLARKPLLTVERKEHLKNLLSELQQYTSGPNQAVCAVIAAVIKTSTAPSQAPDMTARHFLFLGLDNDCKLSLINGLIQSLQTVGKSFLTYIKLDENSCAYEVRKLILREVEEQPYTVLMFDGVEFADASVYGILLEILDKGTLLGNQGHSVDLRNTVVILVSEAANNQRITKLFIKHAKLTAAHSAAVELSFPHLQNAKVKRFRTELLYRIDEVIFFDPLLREEGRTVRCSSRGRHSDAPFDLVLPKLLFKIFEESDDDEVFCDQAANRGRKYDSARDVGSNNAELRLVAS